VTDALAPRRGHSRRRHLAGLAALLACAAARAAPSARVKIACVGDSMVDGIWGGLLRLVQRESCLASRIELGRFGRNGTGLARGDTLDWVAELARITQSYRPTILLASLGLNDHQQIVAPGRERVAYGAAQWTDAYRARVAAFLSQGARADAGLIWIGNPAMRESAMQAQTARLDEIVAETIAQIADPKIVYVAPWRLSLSGEDRYRQYGPAPGGARVQLRAPDGVHFTPAGYDLVADHVLPQLLSHLQRSGIDLVYPCLRLGGGDERIPFERRSSDRAAL
jgi:hypothetical protein